MTREEAILIIGNIPINQLTVDECYSISQYQEAKTMAIKALETLEFAEKNLQFAVKYTRGETKDHYQRALNLLIKENKE